MPIREWQRMMDAQQTDASRKMERHLVGFVRDCLAGQVQYFRLSSVISAETFIEAVVDAYEWDSLDCLTPETEKTLRYVASMEFLRSRAKANGMVS